MEDGSRLGRVSTRVSSPKQAAEVGKNPAGSKDATWCWMRRRRRCKGQSNIRGVFAIRQRIISMDHMKTELESVGRCDSIMSGMEMALIR